ncbi:hypothetical protein ACWENQ_08295 [Nonomuraea sp. NPDC004354]
MSIEGGWQPLTSLAGDGFAGTKVWIRTVTAGEPDAYEIGQNSSADGTVIILAVRGATRSGIVVEPSALDTTCPAATPSTASGLEIRYGAANGAGEAVTWEQLPGYSGLDLQSGSFTSATIAVRTYASNAQLPARTLVRSNELGPAHSLTILIPSSAEGGGTPTPVPFPPFAPVKGLARVTYTAQDLLTGEFRGDLPTLSRVTFDRRIGDQGALSGTIPLPSDLEAAKIREIIPEAEDDLHSGPGRTVIHCWRDDQLWGVYWLHTAVEQRNDRGNVELQLQATTLDGYLNHVALLEAITLNEGDQIANARALLQLVQADPGSDLGLTLQAGLSSIDRPLIGDIDAFVGQVLANYARTDGGFEHVINPRLVDGSILRSWEWGSPKIDRPNVTHEFVESRTGGDIVTWSRTISALSGHTRLRVVGGTPQQTDATQSQSPTRSSVLTADAHRAAGWPWIDKRITHPGNSTDQTTIDDYATYWASRTPGAPRVFSTTVLLGKGSSFDPNGLGDYARITLNNPRYPIRDGQATFDKTMRLIGWSLEPNERGRGKDRLTLITEHQVAS